MAPISSAGSSRWGSYCDLFTGAGCMFGGEGQFNHPEGVAVDASGNVYVADTWNHRIQKFDGNGSFMLKWGIRGTAPGQFEYPTGVAVDAAGDVYVADATNSRIQRFTGSGSFVATWGSFTLGRRRCTITSTTQPRVLIRAVPGMRTSMGAAALTSWTSSGGRTRTSGRHSAISRRRTTRRRMVGS